MSRFRMEQELPATVVSRDLVKSIENLIVKQIEALAKKDDEIEELRAAINVEVTDALGTETMKSIDELGPSKFPDTTEKVGLRFRGPWKSSLYGLEIDVQFHKDRYNSRVKVSCDGANARELAHGISRSLHECVDPHRSSNEWLHPKSFFNVAVGGAIWGFLSFAVVSLATKSWLWTAACFVTFILLVFYQWVLPTLKPYTIFDSRSADSRARWLDWALKGLLGFLLFGTALTLMKDQILKAFGIG